MWDWLSQFRRTVWPAVSVIGLIIAIGTHILDGVSAVSLGLPAWAWESIGAAIFAVALLAIVLGNIPGADYIRRGDTVTLEKPTPTAKSIEGSSVITGETTVSEVSRRIEDDGASIDYNAGSHMQFLDITAFWNLKLGEIALIRRLNVAPEQRQRVGRCNAVLYASGIDHTETSIAKLEDVGAIEEIGEIIVLTERGRKLVYLSNQVLVHDPALVAAYRQITPSINQAVRFDGR